MLSSLVGGAPPDWQLAVLDCTADPSAAAVVFCMRDGAGRAVPLSQGLAFYRLNEVCAGGGGGGGRDGLLSRCDRAA